VSGLVNSPVNATPPAFAAERRAAAKLLLGARRCRSICLAHRALSSKPAAATTDRQTDGRPTVTYTLPVTLKMHDLKMTDKENYGSRKYRTGK